MLLALLTNQCGRGDLVIVIPDACGSCADTDRNTRIGERGDDYKGAFAVYRG